jgi:multiple sugar transport system substrate-binding protein
MLSCIFKRKTFLLLFLLVGSGFWSGCGKPSTATSNRRVLRVWSHQGQEAENLALRKIAKAFNAEYADEGIEVHIDFFPDYQYTEKLSIASAGGDLPDVFDLDGPTVAQFADAGLLADLRKALPHFPFNDIQPAILDQGTYRGTLVALGAYDSALVLYGDRKMLASANITLPPPQQGWTWDEFVGVLEQLQTAGTFPLSLHMQISADEWFTYAFSPLIWSAGGQLISDDGRKTEGVLNSPQNVEALKKWQALFSAGLARTSPVNPDPFGSGESALDWNGHWMAQSHLENKGENLIFLPLPRLGPQIAAASGSWCWAVSAHSEYPEAAALWMRWILDPETGIEPMVNANGSLPARASAYPLFPKFNSQPFSQFRYLQQHHARDRPRTPVYPNLTRSFAAALRDIARGADVQRALDEAASSVQRILDRRPEADK